ncbi:MAG: type II secretion system protein GspG [Sulfitobacter sp.]|nr:MAG: type II secretion system protein GspG [Sulfitobacter sp.]
MINNKQPTRDEHGFTLVELLVVLTILSLLTGLVTVQAISYLESSKISTTKSQIANIATALDLYILDAGKYPTEDQGLTILIEAPTDSTSPWNGPYLASKTVPKDPWGSDYVYKITGRSFQLMSLGADKVPGGEDDDADIVSR